MYCKYLGKNKEYQKQYHKQYYINNKSELKEYDRQYYMDNKSKIKNKNKQWQLNNKNKIKKQKKQYYINNKDKIKQYQMDNNGKIKKRQKQYRLTNKGEMREWHLKNKYYMTLGEFEQMKMKQNNRCVISGDMFKGDRYICVDHNHRYDKSGKELLCGPEDIRQLLCVSCNSAIGFCNEDINIIQNLINYLNIQINNGYYKESMRKSKTTKLKKSQMRIEQDNKCFICNNKFKNDKDCHMDHDHKTNKIRKLLCRKCNSALGYFKEDASVMRNAINYLNKWKFKEIKVGK